MSAEKMVNDLSLKMQKFVGDGIFINVSQCAKLLGISRERMAQILFENKFIKNGNEKLYYIPEVAVGLVNKMISQRECA